MREYIKLTNDEYTDALMLIGSAWSLGFYEQYVQTIKSARVQSVFVFIIR